MTIQGKEEYVQRHEAAERNGERVRGRRADNGWGCKGGRNVIWVR